MEQSVAYSGKLPCLYVQEGKANLAVRSPVGSAQSSNVPLHSIVSLDDLKKMIRAFELLELYCSI